MKIKIIKYQTQQLFSLNTFFLAKLSQELKLYIAVSLFGPLGLFEKPKKRLFSNSKSPHFFVSGSSNVIMKSKNKKLDHTEKALKFSVWDFLYIFLTVDL